MKVKYLAMLLGLIIVVLPVSSNAAAQAEREISASIEPQAVCSLSVAVAANAIDWSVIPRPSLPVTKRYPVGSGYTTVTVTKTDCTATDKWQLSLSNSGGGYMKSGAQPLLDPMKLTYTATTGNEKTVDLSSNPIDFGQSSQNSRIFNVYYTQLFGASTQNGNYQITLTYTVSPA